MTSKKETPEMTLDEVKAQIAAMLAEAQAQAQQIVDEARKATGTEDAMTPEEREAHEKYMNEEVEVKLFKDNDKYRDPVFVGVNGETIAIERGVRVKIKRKFAEVLDNSDAQDYETSLLIEKKSGEFERSGL